MRLGKITLNGFKSFADKTEIAFDHPITAVVGPNGCGKSNVVDAIKWVLGEQSAKSLRGGAMMDVVFNGTTQRKPAGMAAVTLHFENPTNGDGARMLPVETDEVAITRRLFRDGTSEYLINNQKARLRDIRELFFDTGIGTNAYCIIEQGKVDAMLVSNPIDRRIIFEEAAGIAKFKARKNEALRKLDRTEQNLLRCRDKVEEVQRRLRSVKVQATRARTYQETADRLGQLRLRYILAEYHQIRTQLDANEAQLAELDAQRTEAADSLADTERQRNEADLARHQLELRQQQLQQQLLQEQARRDQAEQRRQFAVTSLDQLAQQIERDQGRCEHLLERVTTLTEQHDRQMQTQRQLEQRRDAAEQRITDLQAEHLQRQHELNDAQARLEDEKAGIVNLLRRTTQLHNDISAIDQLEQNLIGHRDRLSTRADELSGELKQLLSARDELTDKRSEVGQLIDTENHRLDEAKASSAAVSDQQRQVTDRLATNKEQRSALDSRRALLEELEESRTGVDEAVKAVLACKAASDGSDGEAEFGYVRGLLADMIDADVEHAELIEAALGVYPQALVVDRAAQLTAHADELGSLGGRVTFLAADRVPPYRADHDPAQLADVPMRRVIDLVRFDAAIGPLMWKLLGRTLIVPDLAAAMKLREALPAGWRFMTEAHEVVELDGRVAAGPLTESAGAGLISRRSELADLQQRLDDLDQAIAADQSQLAQLSDRAAHVERVQQELRQAIYEASTIRVELTSKLDQINASIQRIETEQPVVAAEVEQIHHQLHEADEQRRRHRDHAGQLEAEQTQSNRRADELTEQIASLAAAVELARESLTAARIDASKLAEQISAGAHQLRQLDIARDEAERQHRELVEQVEHDRQRVSELEQTRDQAADQIHAADQATTDLRDELDGFDMKLDAASQRVVEVAERQRQLGEQVGQFEQQIHEQQVERRELEVRSDAVEQRAQDQLSLDVTEAYASYDPEQIDWSQVEAEINELRAKLGRLGNVNLEAINEQSELEQRNEFLSEQLADIDKARRELEQLIDQLNEKSRARFEATFNRIREHFASPSGMFRKLFGGGRADLMLIPDEEGNVDWLEIGVDIIAKPPGKEPQSINLLSGGERTMVAVALLLSIFRSRPSPFCVLDEVDAALDDANVYRYNQVISSFLDHSHFIVITHHKRTMQHADQLYGVTMQEHGVSKLVGVQIDQVGPDSRIGDEAADEPRTPEIHVNAAEPAESPAGAEVAADANDDGNGNGDDDGNGADDDGGNGNGKSANRQRLARMMQDQTPAEVEATN